MRPPLAAAPGNAPLLPGRAPERIRESYTTWDAEGLFPECSTIGWARFDTADPSLGPHSHGNCYEICYIIRGTVEWWVGDFVTNVGPGEIFITGPDEEHGGVDTFIQPCELYWAIVQPGADWLPDLSKLGRQFQGGPILELWFERLLAEHRAVQPIDEATPARLAEARLAARGALQILLTDVTRFHRLAQEHSDPARSTPPQIALAMRAMREHLDQPDCLDRAAAAAGLRNTQFRLRFREATGFSPVEYRILLQIREAKARLRETDQPVTQLALDLGFSSSQYFATVFRKMVGLTPQGFRRLHGGGG